MNQTVVQKGVTWPVDLHLIAAVTFFVFWKICRATVAFHYAVLYCIMTTSLRPSTYSYWKVIKDECLSWKLNLDLIWILISGSDHNSIRAYKHEETWTQWSSNHITRWNKRCKFHVIQNKVLFCRRTVSLKTWLTFITIIKQWSFTLLTL